jgi:hypothetical protein
MTDPSVQLKEGDLEAQKPKNVDIKIAEVKWETDIPLSAESSRHLKDRDAIIPPSNQHDRHHPHIDWRHHHFHLWNADKLPHRSSDAHAVARAEAASWAQMTPLIAATLGPLAVLLSIPSLTQRLHGQLVVDTSDGSVSIVELPYPTINLALSVVVMFFEVMGNVFLILRFSNFHAKAMTWLSYGFWVIKSLIGIANYIQFGVAHPETEDIIYLEGFWVLTAI